MLYNNDIASIPPRSTAAIHTALKKEKGIGTFGLTEHQSQSYITEIMLNKLIPHSQTQQSIYFLSQVDMQHHHNESLYDHNEKFFCRGI